MNAWGDIGWDMKSLRKGGPDQRAYNEGGLGRNRVRKRGEDGIRVARPPAGASGVREWWRRVRGVDGAGDGCAGCAMSAMGEQAVRGE